MSAAEMTTRDYLRLMAEYNQWMNRKLFAVCSSLSDEERTRDLGAFFGSIHRTLDHIVWVDRAWAIRWMGSAARSVPWARSSSRTSAAPHFVECAFPEAPWG